MRKWHRELSFAGFEGYGEILNLAKEHSPILVREIDPLSLYPGTRIGSVPFKYLFLYRTYDRTFSTSSFDCPCRWKVETAVLLVVEPLADSLLHDSYGSSSSK